MTDVSSKKPKGSPSYIDMLKEAIVEWTAQHSGNSSEARKGISLQAIKSYLASNYNIDMKAKGPINHLKVATETAIESGQVVYAGTGHLRYKLGVAEKKAKAGAIAAARSSDNEEDESEEESEDEPSPPPKKKKAPAKKASPAKKPSPKASSSKAPAKKAAVKKAPAKKPAAKKASPKPKAAVKAKTKGAAKKKAK